MKKLQILNSCYLREASEGDRKRLFGSKNGFHFAASVVHGGVSPLHQGRDVGVRKAKQIEAAIVEVVLGEVGIGFGQPDGEQIEMAVGGIAQRRHLFLA